VPSTPTTWTTKPLKQTVYVPFGWNDDVTVHVKIRAWNNKPSYVKKP